MAAPAITPVRPAAVPSFVGLPLGSAAAFLVAAVTGTRHPLVALVGLAVVVLVTAAAAPVATAAGVVVVSWLCVIGFDVVGDGQLRFDRGDLGRLAVLAGALAAGAAARLVAGRARRTVADPYPDLAGARSPDHVST